MDADLRIALAQQARHNEEIIRLLKAIHDELKVSAPARTAMERSGGRRGE